MSNMKNFVIEDGILEEYEGPGGDVVIPEGVTEISEWAFADCDNLTSITIPKSISEIDTFVFDECFELEKIYVKEGNNAFKAIDGVLCDHDVTKIIFCPEARKAAFTIPDGVTEIGDGAFNGCSLLTGITIPGSVIEIGDGAFNGCSSLLSITVPEGVKEIREDAFSGCRKLTCISIPKSVTEFDATFEECINLETIHIEEGNKVFKSIDGVLCNCDATEIIFCPQGRKETFAIPESITKIGEYAFHSCSRLASVTIPESIEKIGKSAFSGCTSLTNIIIPESVTEIGKSAFDGCDSLKSIYLPSGIEIPKGLFSKLSLEEIQCNLNVEQKLSIGYIDCMRFIHLTPEVIAALTICQTSVQWWPGILKAIEDQGIDRSDILIALSQRIQVGKKPSASLEKRILEYITAYQSLISKDALQNVIHALSAKKSKLAEQLEAEFANEASTKSAAELTGISGMIEKIVAEHFQMDTRMARLKSHISSGVSYADKNGTCSIDAILLILGQCLQLPDNSQLDAMDCWHAVLDIPFSEYADQVVQGLDSGEFQKLMQQLVEDNQCVPAVLAMGRYGGETQAEYLAEKMDEWKSHKSSKVCKRNQIIGRTALLESKTVGAIVYFEKEKQLELYAQHYHKNPHDLWFGRVLNFGLNAQGQKQYDLGENKKLQVTVQPDLTVSLYDMAAQKAVKRVPKKGANPEKYQQVTDSISAMKKALKYAVKHGRNMLLDDFLSGAQLSPEQWQERYSGYIARILAQPLIWEQNGRTFLLSDSGLQNHNGEMITLLENMPVRLAHPMETPKEDITAWQKYFTKHSIRQPFLQIWEPMIDFSGVKEDRYQNYPISSNRLRYQEKHGIKLNMLYIPIEDVNLANVEFKGFTAKVLQPEYGDELVIHSIHPNYHNRQTNHIIAFLDYLTVRQKIERDDASVAAFLPSFTLAQITDFIKLATENNCPNVTALLLNYKNEHFADFDPMEEFTLGEL